MKFNLSIKPNELNQYYRDRLFELVDFDAVSDDRKKQIGSNRYEYIDRLVSDIAKNNAIYQNNGKKIGFVYGTFYTIIILFIIRIIMLAL